MSSPQYTSFVDLLHRLETDYKINDTVSAGSSCEEIVKRAIVSKDVSEVIKSQLLQHILENKIIEMASFVKTLYMLENPEALFSCETMALINTILKNSEGGGVLEDQICILQQGLERHIKPYSVKVGLETLRQIGTIAEMGLILQYVNTEYKVAVRVFDALRGIGWRANRWKTNLTHRSSDFNIKAYLACCCLPFYRLPKDSDSSSKNSFLEEIYMIVGHLDDTDDIVRMLAFGALATPPICRAFPSHWIVQKMTATLRSQTSASERWMIGYCAKNNHINLA